MFNIAKNLIKIEQNWLNNVKTESPEKKEFLPYNQLDIIDETFTKMTKDEIAKAKGLRIKVIRFRSGMSYNELADNSPLGRYAEGKLRLLNGHYPIGEPEVGDLIKIVELR